MTIRLFVLLTVLLFTGCAKQAPQELVIISMTPSVDISYYHTWKFDTAACVDSGHEAVDDEFIRTHLFAAVKEVLAVQGFSFNEEGSVDFLVSYHIVLDQVGEQAPDTARARAKLLIRDTKTNRYVWSGEVKRVVTDTARSPEERIQSINTSVQDLLKYFAI